jgi:hypothetical protein
MSERGYGWDDYASEGIAELKSIRDSAPLAKRPGQRKIVDCFVDVYSQGAEHELKGTTFYPDHKGCPDKAHKKASKIMSGVKRSIDEYYKTDAGQFSEYRIDFAGEERSYLLQVRHVEPTSHAQSTRSVPSPAATDVRRGRGIAFTEMVKRTFTLPPIAWGAFCLISGGLGLFLLSASVRLSFAARLHWASLTLTPLLLAAAVFCFMFTRTCYLVYRNQFGYLVGRYFIRRDGENAVMATYVASCSLCPKDDRGRVELTYHRQKGGGYRAECVRNRDQHQFSFDHILMEGDQLRSPQ